MADERLPRRRRRRGASALPAFNLRLRPDVGTALEREADATGTTKAAIIEDALQARYRRASHRQYGAAHSHFIPLHRQGGDT